MKSTNTQLYRVEFTVVEFANLYLSVMSVQRDKVLLIWKLNILLSMAAYGGWIGRTSPPQKKYFFLSNHKWPEFEIIQNPGGTQNIWSAPRAAPRKSTSPGNFHKPPRFYLNSGTIDVLCIIIRTVGAWDFLSQK